MSCKTWSTVPWITDWRFDVLPEFSAVWTALVMAVTNWLSKLVGLLDGALDEAVAVEPDVPEALPEVLAVLVVEAVWPAIRAMYCHGLKFKLLMLLMLDTTSAPC